MSIKKISNRSRAILVGILILVAYGILVSSFTQAKFAVMIADVISGVAVIGIAILMFPLFKAYSWPSYSYLYLKYMEGILMIIGGLIFLDDSFQYVRGFIYNHLHEYVFIVSAFLFYYLLYQTKVVPRFISIWGVIGIFALLISSIFRLLGIQNTTIDFLLILIITNEVFLAFWLIIKGFNDSNLSDPE